MSEVATISEMEIRTVVVSANLFLILALRMDNYSGIIWVRTYLNNSGVKPIFAQSWRASKVSRTSPTWIGGQRDAKWNEERNTVKINLAVKICVHLSCYVGSWLFGRVCRSLYVAI